ncbi:9007_t:CDS:1, partial [Ambispora gerdemannii]
FRVGLINRQDIQQIVNFDELVDALINRGYRPQIIDHSPDNNNDDEFIESAFLYRNLSLLIGSHGNALTNALFMSQSSTVLSISAKFGNDGQEAWYAGPMLSLGRRFYDWECQDQSCVETDRGLARQCLEEAKNVLSPEEMEEFVKLEQHVVDFTFTRNLRDMIKKQTITSAWWCYVRDVRRRVDVDLFVSMVDQILQDYIEWSPQLNSSSSSSTSANNDYDNTLITTTVNNRMTTIKVASSSSLPILEKEEQETNREITTETRPPFPSPAKEAEIHLNNNETIETKEPLPKTQSLDDEETESISKNETSPLSDIPESDFTSNPSETSATIIAAKTTSISSSFTPRITSPSFPDICRQAKCCGPKCEQSMKRNVFGPINAWKQSVEHELEVHVKARNWKLVEEIQRQ